MKPPAHLDWFIWRLVLAQVVTLQELETHWSVVDMLDAHEAIDLQEEAERLAHMKAAGKGR